jgi:ligand-binding SRPBCC domain-containing protein
MPPHKVFEQFDQTLFLKLAPPFPPVKLLRFDGCMPGDVVSLELNFLLFKQVWTSTITAYESNKEGIYFIDEGTHLPFFLTRWHHKHLMQATTDGCLIADDITFESPWFLPAWLLYPVLWLQFAYRKPIYRKMFGR